MCAWACAHGGQRSVCRVPGAPSTKLIELQPKPAGGQLDRTARVIGIIFRSISSSSIKNACFRPVGWLSG